MRRLLPALTVALGLLLAGLPLASAQYIYSGADDNLKVIDVRTYGALGNGVNDDTAAIQRAITAVTTAGGGVVSFPAGTYKITSALVVNMGAPTINMQLRGAGQGQTILSQVTAATDVIQVGATSAEVADNLYIADLTLTMVPAGRYGLNLNNALNGVFERLTINNGTSGLFFQGQNEGHTFRNITIVAPSGRGIDAKGNLNGGPAGGPLNLPETQKTLFEHLRITGSGGPYSIDLDAGVLGGQQTAGNITFRHVRLESNTQNGIRVAHNFLITLEHVTIEDTFSTANTFVGILQDTGSGILILRDAHLPGRTGAGTTYQYVVQQVGGFAYITGSNLAVNGAAGTADLRLAGLGAVVEESIVTSGAAVSITAPALAKTLFLNLLDSTGTPITGLATGLGSNAGVLAAMGGSLKLVGAPNSWQLDAVADWSLSQVGVGTPVTVKATTGSVQLTRGIEVGAPTGGDKGAGTVNLAGRPFVNNVPIADASGRLTPLSTTFAALGAATAGSIVWCSDCTVAAVLDQTCAGAGTGALAVGNGVVWKCIS